jgi:hypothetical protein
MVASAKVSSFAALALALTAGCSGAIAADPEHLKQLHTYKICEECDLSGAKLELLEGPRAELGLVNLNDSSLIGANLDRARLYGAKLRRADMRSVSLVEAFLVKADLTEANLSQPEGRPVNLTGAWLNEANLTKANLTNAQMRDARLSGTNLTDTILTNVDLTNSVFEPTAVPPASAFQYARGLKTLRWSESPEGLILLRNVFKNAGLREQEREVTYALMRSYRKKIGGLEGQLMYGLFEATTDWGMSPARPLKLLLALIPAFAIAYMLAVAAPSKHGAVWRLWEQDRVCKDTGQDEPERLMERGYRLPLYALAFSVLSAFHIGWRDLNVGTWITRLNPSEYALRATGWVRTVSGIQSLISVYLLALAVLTYFGRPFDW